MLVVGAAILRDGRVLAAQRKTPARWEFPGGKVEPGEEPVAALVRECEEELGVRIDVHDPLADDVPLPGDRGVLSVFAATIVSGEPVAREHAELRWLAAGDLDSVNWMPADIPFVAALRGLLAA
ncbi:(deoxy)nucleoside triphosphate pyrophosphohydrolase [Fodinicola acaciae]|uniref:(deoxy)nucleoside triphosphate pyrophosphohydrolase n=1 Tax=Fodinicola acaciae TaxID=2681555 RepID=UPI0013D55DDB|nr:(deoxy)nucleoside triphosphate pyrophosphohydrolase [Fodinicola acaciae]